MNILHLPYFRLLPTLISAVCLILSSCTHTGPAPDPEVLSQQRVLRAQRLRNLSVDQDILPELRLIVDSMHSEPHNACYYSAINVLVDQLYTEGFLVDADSLTIHTVEQAKEENDSIGSAIAHRIRGQMLYKLARTKEALAEFVSADSLLPESSSDMHILTTITSISEWKWISAKSRDNLQVALPAAIKYADAVKKMSETGWRDSTAHFPVTALAFEAYGHLQNGQTDSAQSLLLKARGMMLPELPARAYEHYYDVSAQLYASKGEYDKALTYVDTLMRTHKGFPWFEAYDWKAYSEIYEQAKNFQQAYETFHRYATMHDSLFVTQANKVLVELEMIHQAKMDAEERSLLRTRIIVITICLVCSIIFLVMCLYTLRAEREYNRILVKRLKEQDMLKTIATEQEVFPEPITDIERLDRYMLTQRPYTDPALSRKELAQYMSMSQEKVAALIREFKGQSVLAYINSFRLDEARHMLEASGSASIASIAESLGFGTARTMQRAFKEKFLMSPSEYRKLARQKPSDD